MSIYLIATLDTKAAEIAYVRDRLRELGHGTTLIDAGCMGEPPADVKPDITAEQVFAAAGATLDTMRQRGDRGEAVTKAAQGCAAIVVRDFAAGKVEGVLAIGGSAGTSIGTTAMRALPLGVPKVQLSTLASGYTRRFVGDKDIAMLNSVVDIAGLNRISRAVLAQAAHAMAGMVRHRIDPTAGRGADDKPLIAASMFGVTTPCVQRARELLEQAGYEVLVFHATGAGGQAMESLIREGLIAGVLDITTTELADEIVGGVLSAGPDRLTAAAERGVPQVVSVGATDMVNFHAIDTVPEKFRGRKLHVHNPNVTLMRTTPDECAAIGRDLAAKVSRSKGAAVVMLPLRGVSAIDREGQPFDDPAAREALFNAVRENVGAVEVMEMDCHINDEDFAQAAAARLIEMLALHG